MIRVNPKRLLGRPRNVFYGWWIVVVAASADALKHGTFNRGFSFYVLPLTRELGVGQSLIGLAEMLGRLEGGLQGPLMGWITDRYGPRPVMVLGAVASGAGFMLLSVTGNYVYFLLVFVGLLSLGFRAGYNNAIMPAINQWFRRRRGLAMSLASVGSPLGGMIIAPLIGYLVFEIGWREAAFISGCLVLAVVAPLAYFHPTLAGEPGAASRWGQATRPAGLRHGGGDESGRSRGGEAGRGREPRAGAGNRFHGKRGGQDNFLLAPGARGRHAEHGAFGHAIPAGPDHVLVSAGVRAH